MSKGSLSPNEVESLFRSCGAFLEGHFLLTSGKHSQHYVEKFRVLERPQITEQLCAEFVRRFSDHEIEIVLGAATGGIILAYETARQLSCHAMFTEREDGKMTLRRGFHIPEGASVLVVEDVVTTGGSVREVVHVARERGAHIVGVGVLVDRGSQPLTLDVRVEALLRLPLEAFEPEDCPLCKQGIPLQKPGSRYLASK